MVVITVPKTKADLQNNKKLFTVCNYLDNCKISANWNNSVVTLLNDFTAVAVMQIALGKISN